MIATPVLLGVSHTKQLMINTCTAFWMQRFCVLTISLNDGCILSWGGGCFTLFYYFFSIIVLSLKTRIHDIVNTNNG